jgi:hypothetical protein
MAELARHGRVAQAARVAAYTKSRVYAWRKTDAVFAEAWDDAIATYVEAVEAEVDRRAVEGVAKPMFYLGEQCGEVVTYSDTLLMFRLKALRPEMYRERLQTPQPVVTPEPEAEKKTIAETLRHIRENVYGIFERDEC